MYHGYIKSCPTSWLVSTFSAISFFFSSPIWFHVWFSPRLHRGQKLSNIKALSLSLQLVAVDFSGCELLHDVTPLLGGGALAWRHGHHGHLGSMLVNPLCFSWPVDPKNGLQKAVASEGHGGITTLCMNEHTFYLKLASEERNKCNLFLRI